MRLAAVALIVSCLPLAAAPVPKGKAPLYHVTTVGDKLTCEVKAGDAVTEHTDTVTAAEEKDGAVVVTVSRGAPGRVKPAEKIVVSETGLMVVSDDFREYDPPVARLKLPAKAGDEWDSTPANAKLGDVTGRTNKVIGEEEVEVPAGKFKAVRVDTTISLSGERFVVSHWYAPGVGVVKMVKGKRSVTALKKYTPTK